MSRVYITVHSAAECACYDEVVRLADNARYLDDVHYTCELRLHPVCGKDGPEFIICDSDISDEPLFKKAAVI